MDCYVQLHFWTNNWRLPEPEGGMVRIDLFFDQFACNAGQFPELRHRTRHSATTGVLYLWLASSAGRSIRFLSNVSRELPTHFGWRWMAGGHSANGFAFARAILDKQQCAKHATC